MSKDLARRIELRHLHQIESEYAIIWNAIVCVKTHLSANHQWIVESLEKVHDRAVMVEMLLSRLAAAEAAYRFLHDCKGDESSIEVGRAWDQMRRIGDEARQVLQMEGQRK